MLNLGFGLWFMVSGLRGSVLSRVRDKSRCRVEVSRVAHPWAFGK